MRNKRNSLQPQSGVRIVVKKSKERMEEQSAEEPAIVSLRYFDPEDVERIQEIVGKLSKEYSVSKPNFFYSTLLAARDLLTK